MVLSFGRTVDTMDTMGFIDNFTIIAGGSFFLSGKVKYGSTLFLKLWHSYVYLSEAWWGLYTLSLYLVLTQHSNNEETVISALICLIYFSQISAKVVLIRYKHKNFREVFDGVESLSNSMRNDDDFKMIYLRYLRPVKLLAICKGVSEQFSTISLYLAVMVSSFFAETPHDKLPFPGWLPFDVSGNTRYPFLCVLQYLAFPPAMLMHIYMDTLIITILASFTAQLKYLRQYLEQGSNREGDDFDYDRNEVSNSVRVEFFNSNEFEWWIKSHQSTLRLLEEFKPIFLSYINVSYSVLFLILFLGGLIVTQADTSWSTFQKLMVMMNIISNVIIMYLVSVTADILKDASFSVADGGLSLEILTASKPSRVNFLFALSRAKKLVAFRIWGWFELSSENFLTVVRLTATYFITVLQIKGRG